LCSIKGHKKLAAAEEGEVLAIGCGDLDGDGGVELVVASRAASASDGCALDSL
jgi:hypothetical protein